ncbi:hypothetical protein A3860_26870 [Niastella vici]|uniref:SWIM-type domain-containing protein n=1 Tax=Niastella vici TaxID=1703345 RepID=A0A1V9FWD4_9BACT|nr:SWIM zinc finger family protein [Niastella vici]OQP62637.1 hypothetical protein A3860_26870 [Niastella vici]
MTDLITYQYAFPSALNPAGDQEELFLAKYSEIEKNDNPCYFWGKLTDPFITARCLITLSNVVKSSFNLSPAELAQLKDPIVTTGNGLIRFEGFSHCAGVYARVDVLPDGHDGEFPANGTTNIDFNQPMITALSRISRNENVVLSVGRRELSLSHNNEKIVEKKVPLPAKWIKGLSTVQFFMAASEKAFSFNRTEALQLFQSVPAGKTKTDYYLILRGNKPVFSPVQSASGICIGGLHRLKLLEPLIPYIDRLQVFPHNQQQSTTWQLYFGKLRFSFSLSRDAWRGFSGEGAALESLIEAVPDAWIDAVDKYAYANQTFNAALLAVNEGVALQQIDQIAGRLSAMGLLGYDVAENQFFYRRLPFKLSRILSLNPRMKEAEKLLAENKVTIVAHSGDRTEAKVAGTGVDHFVIIDGEQERCTCTWFSRHQGERGPCKHVLAVKRKLTN